MMLFKRFIPFLYIILSIIACNRSSEKSSENNATLSFEAIQGIKFYEVKRAFESGLSFNDLGFQQEPEWILQFLPQDSVAVYSPLKNKMLNFSIYHDHDNYYRFANEWFRTKLITKDSLVFQRLEVKSLRVKDDERSNVFMTFYAEQFIKKLNTTVEELRKPSKADTAFVLKKVKAANTHPLDSNFFFAARQPVQFKSINPQLTVSKVANQDILLNQSRSYDYLYPEYQIKIKEAYQDFSYTFRAIVDEKGKIWVYDFVVFEEDARASRKKVLQGIADVYLMNMMKITPGKTLEIPHASLIYINIKGKK